MSSPRFAFFDVDETLIALKSMFDFFPFWCSEVGSPALAGAFAERFDRARQTGVPRTELNRMYYRFFQGVPLADVVASGRRWFLARFPPGHAPYHGNAVARLAAHRAAGVQPVFVSGSMRPLLTPIAEALGVQHCLCTQLLTDGAGRLTGEIGQPQTIGEGKAAALRTFLAEQGGLASQCFAYGDDPSDLPMLEQVGTPIAVGAATELALVAQQRGWASLSI